MVGVPDERSGEVPKAFVLAKEDAKATEEDIKNFLKGKVSEYKELQGGGNLRLLSHLSPRILCPRTILIISDCRGRHIRRLYTENLDREDPADEVKDGVQITKAPGGHC